MILSFFSFMCMAVVLSVVLLMAGFLVSKKLNLNQLFMSPFECGFFTLETSKATFSSRFFIMALVFLIFDIELILIFPYMSMNQMVTYFPLFVFLVFINILSVGLYYEWNFSMMDWLY